MPEEFTPNTDRLCTECGTVYTADPGRICSDCLPDAAGAMPGSIDDAQRRQIAALLLVREPVATVGAISQFITGVLGPGTWAPGMSLWELSRQQGAALLEALDAELRETPQAAPRHSAAAYHGKRERGASRRITQGAHRA